MYSCISSCCVWNMKSLKSKLLLKKEGIMHDLFPPSFPPIIIFLPHPPHPCFICEPSSWSDSRAKTWDDGVLDFFLLLNPFLVLLLGRQETFCRRTKRQLLRWMHSKGLKTRHLIDQRKTSFNETKTKEKQIDLEWNQLLFFRLVIPIEFQKAFRQTSYLKYLKERTSGVKSQRDSRISRKD